MNNEDELAKLFQKYRRHLVRQLVNKYEHIPEDDIDCLYVDLWARVISNKDIIRLNGLKEYLFICLDNRVKDLIRARQRSEDVYDQSELVPLNHELDGDDATIDVIDESSLEAE